MLDEDRSTHTRRMDTEPLWQQSQGQHQHQQQHHARVPPWGSAFAMGPPPVPPGMPSNNNGFGGGGGGDFLGGYGNAPGGAGGGSGGPPPLPSAPRVLGGGLGDSSLLPNFPEELGGTGVSDGLGSGANAPQQVQSFSMSPVKLSSIPCHGEKKKGGRI